MLRQYNWNGSELRPEFITKTELKAVVIRYLFSFPVHVFTYISVANTKMTEKTPSSDCFQVTTWTHSQGENSAFPGHISYSNWNTSMLQTGLYQPLIL